MKGSGSEQITLEGAVQGVGLRPFLCREATALGLAGEVRNTGLGLELKVCGNPASVDRLLQRLRDDAPEPAIIDRIERQPLPGWDCGGGFRIADSSAGAVSTSLPPDRATCPACLAELFDPASRRYRHPFISCTACGPRHSILRALPWDRCRTTQDAFSECPACTAEVEDAAGRRFHSQTNSCHDCGPQLWLATAGDGGDRTHREEALSGAERRLRDGAVLAIKGPGGYQLVTRADAADGVARLRRLKQRRRKPLAVMFADTRQLLRYCTPTDNELTLLAAPEAPIVLVPYAGEQRLDPGIAPDLDRLGAMLPATPLQHLLLRGVSAPLVVTSANRRGEPLCYRDDEALAQFGPLLDGVLGHNREIMHPLDDSILQWAAGRTMVLRRGRGLGVDVAAAPQDAPVAVAHGADLKNCPALSVGGRLLSAPHVGSLDSLAGERRHQGRVESLSNLYAAQPQQALCDRHPDYHSTRLARAGGLAVRQLQHHRAHLYAVLAENPEARRPLLAVTWDGTGYGGDGTVWGGECFLVDEQGDRRLASLAPFRLPGGEQAIREPRRTAMGLLHALGEMAPQGLAPLGFASREAALLQQMLDSGVNAPLCSSAGRLFDGFAALLIGVHHSDYEGEAAVRLEQLAARHANPAALPPWPVPLQRDHQPWQLDWGPALRATLAALEVTDPAELAARFHVTLAHAILALAREAGCSDILLGGGCFQNRLLLELTRDLAAARGCRVLWPRRLPPGDGGIAVGQLHAFLTGASED